MKKMVLALLLIVLGYLSPLGLFAEAHAADGNQPHGPASGGLSFYKPPMLGAPKLRVGGGVRGAGGNDAPVVQVIAPQQTGLTTKAEPVLYWHLDKPTPHALEITVMEEGGVSPLVRVMQSGPIAAGLHAFRLTGQGKGLEIGKEYEWFVAVILDPEQRSKDIVASGGLMRVAEPEGLQGKLKAAKADEAGLIYAGAGLWYNAIDALVEGLDKGTDKPALASQFTAILKQEEIAGVPPTVSEKEL